MNKRRRELLNALQPITDEALGRKLPPHETIGFAVRPRAAVNASAELIIYGDIGGGGWFGEGVSAIDVQAALQSVGAGPIDVRINSKGGDVFDGIAIHSLLARHQGTVTVYVDGLAASAASFIMLAADRIVSARNAMIMIHDGMTGTYGGPATHQRALDLLTKASDNIADMYAERAGEDPDYWRTQMSQNGEDGTWFTGQEALTAGLVDELTETPDDETVAARLAVYASILPPVAREFLSEHPIEDDEPDDDAGPGDTPIEPAEPEAVENTKPEDVPDTDADFAHAMRMAHWQITRGRTAREEVTA